MTRDDLRVRLMLADEPVGSDVAAASLPVPLQLAQSAKTIIDGFAQLHAKGLIGDADLLDLAYRFAGELVDVDEVLGRGTE